MVAHRVCTYRTDIGVGYAMTYIAIFGFAFEREYCLRESGNLGFLFAEQMQDKAGGSLATDTRQFGKFLYSPLKKR